MKIYLQIGNERFPIADVDLMTDKVNEHDIDINKTYIDRQIREEAKECMFDIEKVVAV